MRNKLNAAVIISSLFVFGCYYDYDYEYISLAQSMEILEYGKTELGNVRDHHDMPIKYELERDQYILYAAVDKKSIPPAIIFTVEGNTLKDAAIEGAPIKCVASFDAIRPYEVQDGGYPEGGIRFTWKPTKYGLCQNETVPIGENRKMVVSVYDGISGFVAREELRFEIVINGIYRENDSL